MGKVITNYTLSDNAKALSPEDNVTLSYIGAGHTCTINVQVFQTMTIEKYGLFIGFNGIGSVDDVTVYINGEKNTDFVTEEGSFYIFADQFYNGERITFKVEPDTSSLDLKIVELDYFFTHARSFLLLIGRYSFCISPMVRYFLSELLVILVLLSLFNNYLLAF